MHARFLVPVGLILTSAFVAADRSTPAPAIPTEVPGRHLPVVRQHTYRMAGKIRVLAVTSRKRVPSMPDVPTVSEAGYPGLTMESIQGVFGPKGMSTVVRDQIATDVRAVIEADPSIPQRLQTTGQVMDVRGPQDFAVGIKELQDKPAAIAKLVDMKPMQ